MNASGAWNLVTLNLKVTFIILLKLNFSLMRIYTRHEWNRKVKLKNKGYVKWMALSSELVIRIK